MKHIHKEYQQPFVLEPTKLNRLVSTIHERLKDHRDSFLQDHFEVFLTGNRREEMSTVDDVLALDNSRKAKIERLVIVCSSSTAHTIRPEHEVQVDFGYRKPSGSAGTSNTTLVAISVPASLTEIGRRKQSGPNRVTEKRALMDGRRWHHLRSQALGEQRRRHSCKPCARQHRKY